MADFHGTIKRIAEGSWRASGVRTEEVGGDVVETVCPLKMHPNMDAAVASLNRWAREHDAEDHVYIHIDGSNYARRT
jgi:hypothetical protein